MHCNLIFALPTYVDSSFLLSLLLSFPTFMYTHTHTHTHSLSLPLPMLQVHTATFSCLIMVLPDLFHMLSGSNNDVTEQQRKSRTLPHTRHYSVPAAPFPHWHFRSLSECKQTLVQAVPSATLGQAGNWALGPSR